MLAARCNVTVADLEVSGSAIKYTMEAVVSALPSKSITRLPQESLLIFNTVQLDQHKVKAKRFNRMLVDTFEKHVTQTTRSVTSVSFKQQKIWSPFHQVRFSETLRSAWQRLE